MVSNFTGIKILVMGGNGFIGQQLSKALVCRGADVRCFDLNEPTQRTSKAGFQPSIEWIHGDFSDRRTTESALENIDVVYHLVCTTLPASSNKDLAHDLTSNVVPTLNLLDIAKESGVGKLIFVSSGGTIYGEPTVLPISESHPTSPICGYGIHKLTIEKYLFLYHRLYGLNYSIARLSNPYGFNQVANRPQGVVGNFINKALSNEALEIWGDGSVVRDYIHIDDAVEGLLTLVDHANDNSIYNIGSGIGHSLLDVIRIIETVVGNKLDVILTPSRKLDVQRNILNVERALSHLGWAPKIKLENGIRMIIDALHNVTLQ